ncbi:hypothetical protein LZP69_00915 [Shewanella sp. AS1]|uniref:hypothetical protein n=1 Tax=Shewanella sp. AS1 TaxID=2907626 RepID=UPI001F3A8304|nr:hypothetical protein [Shewanella sp. AS1]MCE9677751.1 hypothetical protein [Shewanella sp. AS1]
MKTAFVAALTAIASLSISSNAIASCTQNISYGDIPFAINSSYFASEHTKQLQEVINTTQSNKGYLLLEFAIDNTLTDKKLREYDFWLANRRIERVKDYLSKADYQQPIVTRILTASRSDSRALRVHWCQQVAAVADANPVQTSLR